MNFSDILLLSDFDMTLYSNTERYTGVPQRNIDVINRFMEQGGRFAVATGRAKPSFARHAFEVPSNAPCILSNGALTYSYAEDKTYDRYPLTPEEVEKILSLNERFNRGAIFEVDVGLEVYLPDIVYAICENEYTIRHYQWVSMEAKTAPLDQIPPEWLKTVFSGAPDYIEKVVEAACELGLNAVLSLPFLCEIQGMGVNKGVAARKLADMLGRKTLVCAGDAPNDSAMLAAADIAFVPSGSHPSILAMGYNVVCAVEDGAVADAIEALERMQE